MSAVLSALLVLGLGSLTPAPDRASVPNIRAKTLKNKPLSFGNSKGKVRILTFWATWCVPCKKAIPFLVKSAKAHGDKVEVVAISIDDSRSRSRVQGAVRRYKWGIPVVVDEDGSIAKALNPRGMAPYTLFVDPEGGIALAKEGFSVGDDKLLGDALNALVGESKGAAAKP